MQFWKSDFPYLGFVAAAAAICLFLFFGFPGPNLYSLKCADTEFHAQLTYCSENGSEFSLNTSNNKSFAFCQTLAVLRQFTNWL